MHRRTWIARTYDEHGTMLYRHALMIVGDTAAAEDAVHQVFVKLLANVAPQDDVRSAVAYLRQAVRNECYSWLRARQRDASEPKPGRGAPLARPSRPREP